MRYVIVEDKLSGFCVYPPGATFGARVTSEYEFVWLEKGGALWYYNDEKIEIDKNSVLLTKPNNREFFEWSRTNHSSHYFIHFDLDNRYAAEIEGLSCPESWQIIRTVPENNILKPLLMHAYWLIKNGYKDTHPVLQCTLQQCLRSFVGGVFDIEQGMPDDLPPCVDKVFKYITAKWQQLPIEPVSLEEISAVACVSPTHLCRLFKSAFGKAPMQTLLLIRLSRASSLLAQSNMPITKVAHLTGFESPYHFSRSFKLCYGISPSQYRLNCLEGKRLPLPRTMAKYLKHFGEVGSQNG